MGETISDRARVLFAQAQAKTVDGVRLVLAEHARDGKLNSGATIKRLADMHKTMSRHAIGELTESIGRRVQSRGRKWRNMVEDCRRELDAHIAEAEQQLKGKLLKMVTNGEALVEPLLVTVRERLHRDLHDYKEGWTGTPGKPWSERNKVLYTFLVALGGAAASKLAEAVFKYAT